MEYSELDNENSKLKYFFEVMDDGGYSYNFVLRNYLIPRAIEISEKLDDVLHSEGLIADHHELEHYALSLLMEENLEEDIEYMLGLISIEKNVDLHLDRYRQVGVDLGETEHKKDLVLRLLDRVFPPSINDY